MSAVARAFEPQVDCHDFDPPSGIHRIAGVVVLEPTADLTNAILEVCGEPESVSRLLSLRPVLRRIPGGVR